MISSMTAKEGLACGQILVLRIVREKMQSFMFPYVFGLTNKNKKKGECFELYYQFGFQSSNTILLRPPDYYTKLVPGFQS